MQRIGTSLLRQAPWGGLGGAVSEGWRQKGSSRERRGLPPRTVSVTGGAKAVGSLIVGFGRRVFIMLIIPVCCVALMIWKKAYAGGRHGWVGVLKA